MAIKVIVKIKSLLESRNISLRELSRLTDIGHPILSNLANQKRLNIHLDHIRRIAEALGITERQISGRDRHRHLKFKMIFCKKKLL